MQGDVASIAATTAGVAGTITVPTGAHLKGLDISFAESANTATVISKVALSWVGSPNPLNFVPPMWGAAVGTAAAGGEIHLTPHCSIPLDVTVKDATSVSVTLTSTANLTVKVGLRWD